MPNTYSLATVLIAGLLTITTANAQAVNAEDAGPAADNTAANANDREAQAKTPMDQGNDKDSLAVTAAIRKAVSTARCRCRHTTSRSSRTEIT